LTRAPWPVEAHDVFLAVEERFGQRADDGVGSLGSSLADDARLKSGRQPQTIEIVQPEVVLARQPVAE